MGVHADGGLKIMIFQNFVLAQNRTPRHLFGVKIGGTDAENHEEGVQTNHHHFPFSKIGISDMRHLSPQGVHIFAHIKKTHN